MSAQDAGRGAQARKAPPAEKVLFPSVGWIITLVLLLAAAAFNYWAGALKKSNEKNLNSFNQAFAGFSKQSQNQLTQEVRSLKGEVNYFAGIFDPRERWLKKDYDMTIYFVEELNKANKSLKAKADEKRVDYPELEFKEKLPSETEAGYLLNQLNSIREVVGLGIGYGASFKSITPGMSEEIKGFPGLRQLKTKVEMSCPPRFLADFIIGLGNLRPRPCLDSLLLKQLDGNFTMTLNLRHLIIAPQVFKNGAAEGEKNAVEPPAVKDAVSAEEESVHILRSNNPFIMFDLPEKKEETPPPAAEKPKEPSQQEARFYYKGRAVLRGAEVAVIEDAVKKETLFLNNGEKIGNCVLKSFDAEQAVLFDLAAKKDLVIKLKEK